MNDAEPLSLAALEHYGRVWGEGRERRALCPYCGDEHKRDKEHASLGFNADTGAWTCHRCQRTGLLADYWANPPGADANDPLRPERVRRRRMPPPRPSESSPAEAAEQASKRAALRRLWSEAAPLDSDAGRPGRAYLESRAIPAAVAQAAKVRYCRDYYGRPSALFPVQGERGGLVAVEGRYLDAGTPKSRSTGHKGAGVFVAQPGALDADGVTVCEGPITALSVAAAGFPAIALCGQSAPPWLARRLALRSVLIAFDEGEAKTEAKAAELVAALAGFGAKPYRLRCPAEVGDWNDYLRAYGRVAVTDALTAALLGTWRAYP